MQICINPGTGALNETNEKNAIENMKHFIADCKIPELNFTRIECKDYGEGRYAFLIWKDMTCHEIQMPGLPLDKVRFMDEKTQNIWDFPRLYIDDSSWIWIFAILDEESFYASCD